MMSRITAVALASVLATAASAQDISMDKLPASVVKTVPVCGDAKVAASTTEIRVTFSKDMASKGWSWGQLTRESFPKISGKPRFLKDKRTCVVDVKLEPGRTYALWLNTDKFTGFRDTAGKASVPYLLVFTTL